MEATKTEKRSAFIVGDEISNDEVLAAIDSRNFERALGIVDSIPDPAERVKQRNRILAIKEKRVI